MKHLVCERILHTQVGFRSSTITIVILALWFGSPLSAQSWNIVGTGLNTNGFALAVHDSELYVGGAFTTAGGLPANRIARWNGNFWSAVGTGMNLDVFTLAVYGGNLYAGGAFDTADGNPARNIARWNGSSWLPVGTGINGYVSALAVYSGELYAVGEFDSAGGIYAARVAKWNGTAWSYPSTGWGSVNVMPGHLAIYNAELYAAGSFVGSTGGIARWNGTTWSNLPDTGMNWNIDGLGVFNAELYAGGIFTYAGGVPANRVARWDGTNWSSVGGGITGGGLPGVRALAEYNSELYAGGSFDTAGVVPASNIARWNGTSWSPLGQGTSGRVDDLTEYNSELYVVGIFGMAGGIPVSNIARWSSIVGVKVVPAGKPTTYALSQNFPNPFNPATAIRFDVAAAGRVGLRVFNYLGQEVAVLVNENLGTGRYEVNWNARGFASGVYFYRLQAGSFVETRKLVLLK